MSRVLLLVAYFAILGTLVLGLGYGVATIVSVADQANESRPVRTLLDERIATSQEIREALRRPIPRPDPLPSIMAKPFHPATTASAEKSKAKASAAARNAMAMERYSEAPPRQVPAFDRAATSGW
jgi:hypothetical protein